MDNGVKTLHVVRDSGNFTVLLRREQASPHLAEVASRIRLIASDGDGCVLPYRSEPDPVLIERLQSVILARGDSFGFSVVTGNHENSASVRFATEVNCPSFCEMGNVLHEPDGELKILIKGKDVEFIRGEAKQMLDAFIAENFPGYKEPPKRTMLSYSRPADVEMEVFVGAIQSFIEKQEPRIRKQLETSYWTRNTLDITFKGDNKGKALDYLATYYRVEKSEMVYVGDGNNDIKAFQRVLAGGGIGIAPANADEDVRSFIKNDRTGRMILHPLESTECMWDITSTVFIARN